MKFGKYLLAHQVSEWALEYVRYKRLKTILGRLALSLQSSKTSLGLSNLRKNTDSPVSLTKQLESSDVVGVVVSVDPGDFEFENFFRAENSFNENYNRDTHNHLLKQNTINLSNTTINHNENDSNKINEKCKDNEGIRKTCLASKIFPKNLKGRNEEIHFLKILDSDLSIVNCFFILQLEIFIKEFNSIRLFFQQKNDQTPTNNNNPPNNNNPNKNSKTLSLSKKFSDQANTKTQLSKAIRELYRGLLSLQNFKILNYTAFVKILKKHDKISPNILAPMVLHAVISSFFIQSKRLDQLISDTENMYAALVADGNYREGMNRLRPVKNTTPWIPFQLGFMMGLSICMFCILISIISYTTSKDISTAIMPSFPVYRGLGLVTFHIWVWGIDVYFYRRARVNHSFVMEMDPRSEMSFLQIFQIASFISFLVLSSLNLYLFIAASETNVHPGYFHFGLFLFFLCGLLWPFQGAYQYTRSYLLRTLSRIVTSPFSAVGFKEVFIGDQLCSLVLVVNDLFFMLCYYFTGDFIAQPIDSSNQRCSSYINTYFVWITSCLPYLWRFLQCINRYYYTSQPRQAWNALKYLSSVVTTLLSLLHSLYPSQTQFLGLWILAALVSSLYSSYWDIRMDWNVVEEPEAHRFLRTHFMIRAFSIYYVAALVNILLRASWIFTISPDSLNITIDKNYLKLILAVFEIARRCIWNYFRVENEHVNNIEQFRVVNIVPLNDFYLDGEIHNQLSNDNDALHHQGSMVSSNDHEQIELEQNHNSHIHLLDQQKFQPQINNSGFDRTRSVSRDFLMAFNKAMRRTTSSRHLDDREQDENEYDNDVNLNGSKSSFNIGIEKLEKETMKELNILGHEEDDIDGMKDFNKMMTESSSESFFSLDPKTIPIVMPPTPHYSQPHQNHNSSSNLDQLEPVHGIILDNGRIINKIQADLFIPTPSPLSLTYSQTFKPSIPLSEIQTKSTLSAGNQDGSKTIEKNELDHSNKIDDIASLENAEAKMNFLISKYRIQHYDDMNKSTRQIKKNASFHHELYPFNWFHHWNLLEDDLNSTNSLKYKNHFLHWQHACILSPVQRSILFLLFSLAGYVNLIMSLIYVDLTTSSPFLFISFYLIGYSSLVIAKMFLVVERVQVFVFFGITFRLYLLFGFLLFGALTLFMAYSFNSFSSTAPFLFIQLLFESLFTLTLIEKGRQQIKKMMGSCCIELFNLSNDLEKISQQESSFARRHPT